MPQWWLRAPELLGGGKVTEKALQEGWWCRCVEALWVDLHVGIGGVDIYTRSRRRRSAEVVIEGTGTARRWKSHREGLASK